MTYQSDEISVHDGQPVELYEISLRNTTSYWRYTSAGYDITYDGNVYTATPGLYRQEIEETEDPLKADLKIMMPSSHAFPRLFLLNTPDGIIEVTIFRGHQTNFIQYWDGILKVCNPLESNDEASLICGPHTDAMQVPFMMRTYSRLCDVPLYSTACGLTAASYAISSTVTTVSGATLISFVFEAHADGYFTGGYVESNGFKRKVKSHIGSTVVLVRLIPGLENMRSIVIYPGCDHTRATCISKYNNVLNNRGCEWIPDDEPFTQGVLK